MSLKGNFPTQIPQETARFVEPLLSEESVYRFIGQHAALQGHTNISIILATLTIVFSSGRIGDS
jgi:hypothetical protein